MATYRFFLSYSWKNRGLPLQRFFEDLAKYVRARVGGDLSEIAFRDRVTMKAGEPWPQGLLDALKTSQVLVYLLSVDYVQSDYCGKELQTFLARVRTFERKNPGVRAPLFIQPVIWVPPVVANLPQVIAERQPEDDAFPNGYAAKGLESLAKQRDKTAYNQCVGILGDRIIQAATGDRLPPLTEYNTLDVIPNAFTEAARVTSPTDPPPVPSAPGGPTEVKCVYVAGSAQELSQLVVSDRDVSRTDLSCYGYDGWYWQPFNPPVPTTIGSVVQDILRTEYRYREVSIEEDIEDLIRKLRTAADRDQIVLLIVDAWSAFLHRYKEFLEKFDTSVLWNNAVLVPWNDCDEQTKARRAKLDAQLRLLFRSKYPGPQPSPRFRSGIRTIEEFRSVLLSVLEMIRSEIETHRAAQLQIQGPPIAQIRTSREQPDAR